MVSPVIFRLGADVFERGGAVRSAVSSRCAVGEPSVGARGRQFSYLGSAPVSTESASLVQLGLLFGLGVDP